MSKKYYIWSNEHNAWWRPEHAGYTHFIESAGLYSDKEALEICNGANYGWDMNRNVLPDELPIHEDIAKKLYSKRDRDDQNN